MTVMSKAQIGRFLIQGTLTGKLATVKKDVSSHVVPIWFVLDKGNSRGKVGDIVFTTGDTSVKANNIQRDNRVSICVDDQIPPFSFVTIFGTAKIYPYKQKEVFKCLSTQLVDLMHIIEMIILIIIILKLQSR